MEAANGDRRNRSLVVVLAAALLAAFAGILLLARGGGPAVDAAQAAARTTTTIDHFQCYTAKFTPSGAVDAAITLEDQFSAPQAKSHRVGKPKFFCNPAGKTHGTSTFPILNPNNHLTAYQLNGKTPRKRLHVLNQFQSAVPDDPPNVITDKGSRQRPKKPLILVPTAKEGHASPAGLDHFKCYSAERISRSVVDQSVQLTDQFVPSRGALVKRVKFLCNPAEKVHDETTVPVTSASTHLVCYTTSRFSIPTAQRTPRDISNQFGAREMTAKVANMLCVPSQKFLVGS